MDYRKEYERWMKQAAICSGFNVESLLPAAAAMKIQINILTGKQRKRSMVTASGFFIIPPRSDAVTIAAPNTTCPPSGPQVSIAMPYPIHTPAKMTGKKCPPFKPN